MTRLLSPAERRELEEHWAAISQREPWAMRELRAMIEHDRGLRVDEFWQAAEDSEGSFLLGDCGNR